MVKLEVDKKAFKALTQKASKAVEKSWIEAGKVFKKVTPKDSGNAKRKTKYNKKRIEADYNYASVLDQGLFSTGSANSPQSKVTSKGYSKQAPEGMSNPSTEKFNKELTTRLRKL